MKDETSDDQFLREYRAAQAAAQRLKALPVEACGHVFRAGGHPFGGLFAQRGETSLLHANLVQFEQHLKETVDGGRVFPLTLQTVLSLGLLGCARCGLYDWNVDKTGLHPLGPCPFVSKMESSVEISAPSGKLCVGVMMSSFFRREEDQGKRLIDRFDGTHFRSHHATQLWANYNFVEVQLASQDDRLLYRSSNGGLVLTRKEVLKVPIVAEIFTYMPMFACADAELFEPLYAAQKSSMRIDATFDIIDVTPGTYRICLAYGKTCPLVTLSTKIIPARVTIDRIGPATALLTADAYREKVADELVAHPWLYAAYMQARRQSQVP